MSHAWEVTREDVERELEHHGGDLAQVDAAYEAVCAEDDRITDVVLCCTDFDEQTEAAGQEIVAILVERGFIEVEPRRPRRRPTH